MRLKSYSLKKCFYTLCESDKSNWQTFSLHEVKMFAFQVPNTYVSNGEN